MKPVDYRNATFHDLLKTVSGKREETLRAWRDHGPCTTEELADRSGLSILTLRPRTTELYQLGFVMLADSAAEATTSGAVYRAATTSETQEQFGRLKRNATEPQAELSL